MRLPCRLIVGAMLSALVGFGVVGCTPKRTCPGCFGYDPPLPDPGPVRYFDELARDSTIAPGMITGLVIGAEDGKPVSFAHAELRRAGENSGSLRFTDVAGHFRFDSVAPGTDSMTASRIGYHRHSLELNVLTANTVTIAVRINTLRLQQLAVDSSSP